MERLCQLKGSGIIQALQVIGLSSPGIFLVEVIDSFFRLSFGNALEFFFN